MGHSRVLLEEKIESRFLEENRTVRVSLPASYHRATRRRYPVLYVHDGQNVLSSAGPDSCFGWGSWQLDLIAEHLAAAGKMDEIIIVAVDNSRHRYGEYRGPAYDGDEDDPPSGERKRRGASSADDTRFASYASFLIKELKTRIDGDHRTKPAAKHTGLIGSSLGGICSLALAWEHPKSFGLAASLSGSFHIEQANFVNGVLRKYRGKPKQIRIYLDSGAVDSGGDDDGHEITGQVAAQLRRIGWKEGRNLKHYVDPRPFTEAELERAGLRRDKWHDAQVSQHNEFYWRQRLWRPLTFLFPRRVTSSTLARG